MRRAALVCLFLLLAACGGDTDSGSGPATDSAPPVPPATEGSVETEPVPTEPPETDPPETEPAPALAPFEPLGPGPYGVGVTTVTITDEDRDRPLTVDLWFPVDEGAEGAAHRYTFVPGTYYESPGAITATQADASDDGPFPLVAYSHGSGGIRYQHSNYTETLASHGYIVAAPDHTGNTAVDRIAGGDTDTVQVAYDRPADIVTVIDELTIPGNPETKGWPKRIDAESIAVTGHSFGGFTTLAVGAGFENAAGSVAADERVDALIPLAPASTALTPDELARITAPLLVMVGTNDQTTPANPNVDVIWENVSSDPLYRADLVDAQHQTFSDACAYIEFVSQLPEPNELVFELVEELGAEGCSPGDMPTERAQDLTNTLAVTFLDSVFRGGEMITEDNTEIPDDLLFETR